jgi:hypothetical protein
VCDWLISLSIVLNFIHIVACDSIFFLFSKCIRLFCGSALTAIFWAFPGLFFFKFQCFGSDLWLPKQVLDILLSFPYCFTMHALPLDNYFNCMSASPWISPALFARIVFFIFAFLSIIGYILCTKHYSWSIERTGEMWHSGYYSVCKRKILEL